MKKKKKIYPQAVIRLDSATLIALDRLEKALEPGILSKRSTAIRRAILNEAGRLRAA